MCIITHILTYTFKMFAKDTYIYISSITSIIKVSNLFTIIELLYNLFSLSCRVFWSDAPYWGSNARLYSFNWLVCLTSQSRTRFLWDWTQPGKVKVIVFVTFTTRRMEQYKWTNMNGCFVLRIGHPSHSAFNNKYVPCRKEPPILISA